MATKFTKIDTAYRTAAFRTELELALGWYEEGATLRELAADVGATVDRVRYHVQALEQENRVVLEKDRFGRIVVLLGHREGGRYGLVRRLSDGKILREATHLDQVYAERARRRETTNPKFAHRGGLGVICVWGFMAWVEPPMVVLREVA